MKEVEIILSEKGITPTPVRKLVYKCLADARGPLSLSDLEIKLDTVDKSTISRTLSTFKEHQLLHSFNDGSGSVKYELCISDDSGRHDDLHVHFRCKKCGKTICLQEVGVPTVKLPEGYLSHEVNYVVTGICSDCSQTEKFVNK